MKPAGCPRAFEAEALRDGRLTGDERRAFESHLRQCLACTREAKALEELGEALRASSPVSGDDLAVRRERIRLLAAFDRAVVETRGPSHRRLLALAAALVLVVGVALVSSTRRSPEPSRLATIDALEGARWSRRTEAKRDVVFVDAGRLHIRTPASKESVALLVVLPDGELEDIGTTFSVTVEEGRTTHVAVEEGSVLLRLRGRAPVAIGAGAQWQAEPLAVTARDEAIPAPIASPPRRAAPPRAPPEPPDPVGAPTGAAPDGEASQAFRAAVAALDAGRHAEAARLLARFIADHPRDPRAQDAAYLRVVALQAAGDTAAMRAAALDYLHAYPKGFRRAEVEPLAR